MKRGEYEDALCRQEGTQVSVTLVTLHKVSSKNDTLHSGE